MSEYLAAVRRDEYIFFDSNSAPAFDVNAGLNGEDHAGLQNVRRICTHRRTFVHLHTQAVTRSMGEILVEAGLGEFAASGRVNVTAFDAGTSGGDGRVLGRTHRIVNG